MGEPKSLVSPEWELIDPTPDIHALFIQFNTQFFWGTLCSVEIKWSPRMTLCAGLCRYEKRAGYCSISLSTPLLKLRPRKDLVETLLHEMIHAYLFVTENNRDREGHGPEFQKHMHRINSETGTRITVYHSFHAEVRLYKQHWWRCSGSCTSRPPFFGFVKRSMNRAPGPNDTWWEQHRSSCSGTFIKVKEPEGYGKKKTKSEGLSGKSPAAGDIRKFFSPTKSTGETSNAKSTTAGIKSDSAIDGVRGPSVGSQGSQSRPNGGAKPWSGGGGTRMKSNGTTLTIQAKGKTSEKTPHPKSKPVNAIPKRDSKSSGITGASGGSEPGKAPGFSGQGNVLGGGSGVSRLLAQFGSSRPQNEMPGSAAGNPAVKEGSLNTESEDRNGGEKKEPKAERAVKTKRKRIHTLDDSDEDHTPEKRKSKEDEPVGWHVGNVTGENQVPAAIHVGVSAPSDNIQQGGPHTEILIDSDVEFDLIPVKTVPCPACDKPVNQNFINEHLDTCLQGETKVSSVDTESEIIGDFDDENGDDWSFVERVNQEETFYPCPVCSKQVLACDMNHHLDRCAL